MFSSVASPFFSFFPVRLRTAERQLLFPRYLAANRYGGMRRHPPLEENEWKSKQCGLPEGAERWSTGTRENRRRDGEGYGTKGGSCLRCILGDNEEDDIRKVARPSRVRKFQINN